MVEVPRPPPTPERRREYRRAAAVGQVIKAMTDVTPPKTGVTRLDPLIEVRWDKKVRRYRIERGMKTLTGKKVGGRFVKAPDYAPPERKRGGRRQGRP